MEDNPSTHLSFSYAIEEERFHLFAHSHAKSRQAVLSGMEALIQGLRNNFEQNGYLSRPDDIKNGKLDEIVKAINSAPGMPPERYLATVKYIDGLFLEFGVAEGTSLRCLSTQFHGRTWYGFDSFKGLPEQWRTDAQGEPQGAFACDVPTDLPPNVELVVGLFADTLPKFMAGRDSKIALAHIDCDLYSSTKCVLDNIAPYCVPGTVLAFDEIVGYAEYDQHEAKAFAEFLDATGFGFDCIGHRNLQAGFVLK